MIQEISDKAASTTAVAAFMEKVDTLENRIKSVDDWAGEVAWNTDPESLWKEISGKDEMIKALEIRVEEVESNMGPLPRVGPMGDIQVKIKKVVEEDWLKSGHRCMN